MPSQSTLAHPRHASSYSSPSITAQSVVGPSGSTATGRVPLSVQAAQFDALGGGGHLPSAAFYDAAVELGISQKRDRLARGVPAARRSITVTKTVVATLDALGEKSWAHRINQCGQSFWTVGCPNGHGGVIVPSPMAKRCGLGCCPVCARSYARKLSAELWSEVRHHPQRNGYRWRFVTLSLKPRSTHQESWNDIVKVRSKVTAWFKKLGFTDAVAAIEFGSHGHPHLHILIYGGWIDRDTLSKMLVVWTGGQVKELDPEDWIEIGSRRTKRGKKHYRKWLAVPPKSGVGGDWYVDVREVKHGLSHALREVAKYLANPYGGGVMADAQGTAKIVGAARLAAAVTVAGKGKHRVQGYGLLRGVVGRALGKKNTSSSNAVLVAAGVTSTLGCCSTCQAQLVAVKKMDQQSLVYFNRVRVLELSALSAGQGPPIQ